MTQDNLNDVDVGLENAARFFRGTLQGTRAYGWNKKSAGSKIQLNDDSAFWLRVQFGKTAKLNKRLWEGEVAARTVYDVNKPKVIDFHDWKVEDVSWRATLMTYVREKPCSKTPEIKRPIKLSQSWFADLKKSLHALGRHSTNRINTRQELVSRRIAEELDPSLPTIISNWTTCHGDLHWANLTHPDLTILDWEGWGLGPQGLDAAFLLAFSVLEEKIANAVRSTFHDELFAKDGAISVLFACAELQRMIRLHGDHPKLKPGLVKLANTARSTLLTID